MKKILITLMFFSPSVIAVTLDGVSPSTALQETITHQRTCAGAGMPDGLPNVLVISGTGTVYTTTYTCAAANKCPTTKTWIESTTRTGADPDYTFTTTCKALQ